MPFYAHFGVLSDLEGSLSGIQHDISVSGIQLSDYILDTFKFESTVMHSLEIYDSD
jgi:hypothetical protein